MNLPRSPEFHQFHSPASLVSERNNCSRELCAVLRSFSVWLSLSFLPVVLCSSKGTSQMVIALQSSGLELASGTGVLSWTMAGSQSWTAMRSAANSAERLQVYTCHDISWLLLSNCTAPSQWSANCFFSVVRFECDKMCTSTRNGFDNHCVLFLLWRMPNVG